MAGMDGLGRVFNVISVADTKAFRLDSCSAVSFIVTSSGASSIAIAAGKTYATTTTAASVANGFGFATTCTRWYQAAATDGTVAWTKQTASWSTATLTLAGTTGYTSVFTLYGSQMADGYKYIKGTCTNGTLVVVLHDLTVQRTPANLQILGA